MYKLAARAWDSSGRPQWRAARHRPVSGTWPNFHTLAPPRLQHRAFWILYKKPVVLTSLPLGRRVKKCSGRDGRIG
ncbi:hypothetical protein F504_563 [Ralstonia pseudosolanacearum FQY_4]|nr:hypothetical protein F504_563 [Ralstonia pseudosolanacearum FQY_4]